MSCSFTLFACFEPRQPTMCLAPLFSFGCTDALELRRYCAYETLGDKTPAAYCSTLQHTPRRRGGTNTWRLDLASAPSILSDGRPRLHSTACVHHHVNGDSCRNT